MDLFRAYWKTNRAMALALLLISAVFAGVFALYRLPVQAVAYAAAVCLFFGCVWFAVDFGKFTVRHRALRRLCEEAELGVERLPPPAGGLEADYQRWCARWTPRAARRTTKCSGAMRT